MAYWRGLSILYIALMVLSNDARSGIATQTDWSGSNPVWGPLIEWGADYYADTGINTYTVPSDLELAPLQKNVACPFDDPRTILAADINGDGLMDIAGASTSSDDICWWENMDGSGMIWTRHDVEDYFEGACALCSADMNGDGHLDIIGAAAWADQIAWWENTDGSGIYWVRHNIDLDFDYANSVCASDVNGDGYIDVTGSAHYGDEVAWWENTDGSGTNWIKHTVDGYYDGPIGVCSADINNDGYTDVLAASKWDDRITWWRNDDGSGTVWPETTIDGDFEMPSSISSGDLNGDGCIDVLAVSGFTEYLCWWENADGLGNTWDEHAIFAGSEDFFSVFISDINGDGFEDVLCSAYGDDRISWWENVDGTGTEWTRHIVDNDYNSPSPSLSADIDGNGNQDVVCASFIDNDISWWNLDEFSSQGRLESSVLDVQEDPAWDFIDWNSTEPPGTSVAFLVRASSDYRSMGDWSDTLTAPCSLSGLISDNDRYFQYKAILSTTDSLSTPLLHDVTVTWDPFGFSHEAGSHNSMLFGAVPNPTGSISTIVFCTAEETGATLTVYDIAGRTVFGVTEDYSSGLHQISIEGLSKGLYLVRMTTEEMDETRSFIVLE